MSMLIGQKKWHILVHLVGSAGFLLLLLCAFSLLRPESFFVWDWFSPSQIVVSGTIAVTLRLILIPGYKKAAFYVSFGFGLGCIILALYPGPLPVPLNDGILLIAACVSFLGSVYVSSAAIISRRFFTFVLPLCCTLAVLVLSSVFPHSRGMVYSGELDRIAGILDQLDPAYHSIKGAHEELYEYIAKRLRDHREDDVDTAKLIEELNRHIAMMEAELERFEAVSRENRLYAEQISELKQKIGDLQNTPDPVVAIQAVSTFDEAVRPTSPIVRDFAVRLASASPGSYSRYTNGYPSPGAEGIGQIIAIHRYISSQWKYVTDPLTSETDYYSPADRSIALGLAGDCDDFAILLASCIEAVGGRARILHGSCSDGAHAWCEAFIGNSGAWSDTLRLMQQNYPGRTISYLQPGDANDWWLCLDWQAGIYSCGENPAYLYETSGRF